MKGAFTRSSLVGLMLVLMLAPRGVTACAACFGRSDSRLAEGMNMGIFALLFVVLFVLGGVAAFFIFLARRASATVSGAPARVLELDASPGRAGTNGAVGGQTASQASNELHTPLPPAASTEIRAELSVRPTNEMIP